MSRILKRLAELQITLPEAAAPVANYVPYVITGNLLVISGQVCFGLDGKLAPEHIGKLGGGVTPENGKAAARLCALNVLALTYKRGGDIAKPIAGGHKNI